MDLSKWNRQGRKRNAHVTRLFTAILEKGKDTDEDLAADPRSERLANAVLAKVVALNARGKWKEARKRFDPAHLPFVPHMPNGTEGGLSSVVILGPDRYLVRKGEADDKWPQKRAQLLQMLKKKAN